MRGFPSCAGLYNDIPRPAANEPLPDGGSGFPPAAHRAGGIGSRRRLREPEKGGREEFLLSGESNKG
jgi:hypothetical protein